MTRFPARVAVPLAAATAILVVGGGLVIAELGEADRPPAFQEGGERFGPEALPGRSTLDPPPPGESAQAQEPEASTSTPRTETIASTEPAAERQHGTVDVDPTRAPAQTPTRDQTPTSSETTSQPVAPQTGRYRYELDGWEATSAPGSRRQFPDSADVFVHDRQDHADGSSVTVDVTYSDDHEERLVLRYGQGQIAVTFEGGKVSFFGGGVTQTSQATYRPPLIRTAWPADPGQTWTGTSEARDPDGTVVRRERYTGRIRGTEAMTVAGQTLRTAVVEWESEFSGRENGWRQQTLWFSPDLGMWVKIHDRVHAERSGFAYDKDATLTLREGPG